MYRGIIWWVLALIVGPFVASYAIIELSKPGGNTTIGVLVPALLVLFLILAHKILLDEKKDE